MKIKLFVFLLLISFVGFTQSTYIVGNTEYYYDLIYVTTGRPMVKRNATNKRLFLESKGFTELPKGYEIDHIIPLSEGGTDDESNMQLLTISQHKRKTAKERKNRSKLSSNIFGFGYYTNLKNSVSPNSSSYRRDKNGKIIFNDFKGGEYYYNKSGKKKYVKTSKTFLNNTFTLIPNITTQINDLTKYSDVNGEKYVKLPKKITSVIQKKYSEYISTSYSKPSKYISNNNASNGNKVYIKSESSYTLIFKQPSSMVISKSFFSKPGAASSILK